MSREPFTGSTSTVGDSTVEDSKVEDSTDRVSDGDTGTLRDSLDPLLSRAFGVSMVVHLVLLTFGPVPSTAAIPPPPLNLRVILPSAPEPETDADVDSAVIADPAARLADEPEPEFTPKPEPVASVPRPDADSSEVTRATILPTPTPAAAAEPEPEPEPTASSLAEVDPDAVARLLEATIAHKVDSARQRVELRYHVRIRETVRAALAPEHPGLAMGEEHPRLPSFRLSFRVDRDGYMMDLSLRRAPGTPAIPSGMQRSLRALSPFAAPPPDIDKVFRFVFFIEFL